MEDLSNTESGIDTYGNWARALAEQADRGPCDLIVQPAVPADQVWIDETVRVGPSLVASTVDHRLIARTWT